MKWEDEALAAKIRAGDWKAFDELYARYREAMYNYFLYLEGDPQRAGDRFQEMWLRVVRHLKRARSPIRNFRAWIFRVAANVYRDSLRKKRFRRMREVFLDSPQRRESLPQTATDAAQIEFHTDLQKAIAALPLRQRQVFVLKEIHGLEHQEIAEILQISVGASKSTLFHAIRSLRQTLRDWAQEERNA